MKVKAEEIDDLLYWTLQQSWPTEQHLVDFATRQIGYVNDEGNCGLRYPGSDIFPGLLSGQVAVYHWHQDAFIAVSEVAYLKTMMQFLKDRGKEVLLAELPDPESRRRDHVLVDVSGASTIAMVMSCLRKQLGLVQSTSHLYRLEQAICDDCLATMPRHLVIEGFGFLECFLPSTGQELRGVFERYREAFPDRTLTLHNDSPSGGGQFIVELN